MIGVIYFPGTNCESETARIIQDCGLQANIIRWNQLEHIPKCNAFVIPGGWSFEDRIRAGAIAARTAMMNLLKQEVAKGKPLLGICNGAQIIAEAGLLGEVALAPNKNPFLSGYYCDWVWLKVKSTQSPWLSEFNADELFALPIAHGEGRFISADKNYFHQLSVAQKPLVYCDKEGNEFNTYPINPNGATENIAAIANGNIMAIMPHPERASYDYQVGSRTTETLARKMFTSLKRWMHG